MTLEGTFVDGMLEGPGTRSTKNGRVVPAPRRNTLAPHAQSHATQRGDLIAWQTSQE